VIAKTSSTLAVIPINAKARETCYFRLAMPSGFVKNEIELECRPHFHCSEQLVGTETIVNTDQYGSVHREWRHFRE
jgi:hypothetical protein